MGGETGEICTTIAVALGLVRIPHLGTENRSPRSLATPLSGRSKGQNGGSRAGTGEGAVPREPGVHVWALREHAGRVWAVCAQAGLYGAHRRVAAVGLRADRDSRGHIGLVTSGPQQSRQTLSAPQ